MYMGNARGLVREHLSAANGGRKASKIAFFTYFFTVAELRFCQKIFTAAELRSRKANFVKKKICIIIM